MTNKENKTMKQYKKIKYSKMDETTIKKLEEQREKLKNMQEQFAKQKKEQDEKILNKKSFFNKAVSYLKAESSQATQGKVSNSNFEKRKKICMECEFKANDVQLKNGNIAHDSIGWCKGGCGCSVGTERAALSTKLYMPTLSCPKGKFGVESGAGFEISDAVDSAKGIFTSAIGIFKKP